MRYALKLYDNRLLPGLGWNKKSHAESWIQYHLKLYGGLDWRVGGLFKAKHDNQMEIVWSKSKKSVHWFMVEPASLDEYDPGI